VSVHAEHSYRPLHAHDSHQNVTELRTQYVTSTHTYNTGTVSQTHDS